MGYSRETKQRSLELERIHSEANARRIACVESAFGGSGESLGAPGRVLVGEGVLTKLCRKKPKPRQFFLFNDILVYGNIVINKKKYNKQHILPLENVKLVSLEDDGPLRHGWQIISPEKSFAVFAATATEKSEWMAHIHKCIQDLLARTGKKQAKDHAAVWVPDSEAPVCMVCTKTKFTALNRRHHCRKCGLVVCSKCSSQKYLLPHIANKPLRVCDNCFEVLGKDGSDLGTQPEPRRSPLPDTDDDDDDEGMLPPPPPLPEKKGAVVDKEGSSAGEEEDEEHDYQNLGTDVDVPQFYTDSDQM
ncbi:pleckstrin homology domain-containing family F member 2-like isoform X2 [Oscarella lobularis]|uniref:pleckstrin homology domain-containing family F member 2-like isoform X2 n=1 Tax=Oscarella lobularis TaxID=121494 RepID=UPI00331325ED